MPRDTYHRKSDTKRCIWFVIQYFITCRLTRLEQLAYCSLYYTPSFIMPVKVYMFSYECIFVEVILRCNIWSLLIFEHFNIHEHPKNTTGDNIQIVM